MLECIRTHTNTYIIHAYHIHRYIHICIYTCIHIHKVGPVRTGGGGFEGQGRRKHACLAAYPVAISPSPYSGSSVCSCLSLVSVHVCSCHLVPSRSLCFFASPQHACSAASSRLCFGLCSRAHAQLVRAPVRASFSLPPPLSIHL